MPKLKYLFLLLLSSVNAFTVELESVSDYLTLKGKIESHEIEYIHLPFAAKVKAIQPFGHIVQEGEPIFSIEYLSSNESLTHIIIEYHQTLQALSLSTQNISTQKELMDAGAISQNKFQEALLAYEKKFNEISEKKEMISKVLKPYGLSIEDINQLQDTSLDGINAFVKEKVPNLLFAPTSGILLPTAQDPHADIFKAHTYIAKVVDHHAFEVNLSVSEKQLTQLKDGQSVDIKLPSIQKNLTGVVFNVNRYPQPGSSKSKYGVSIRFTDIDEAQLENIYLGMSCIINIELSNKKVLLIPLTAVQTIADKSMVILSTNDTFKGIREVTLGKTHGDKIEVLTGLKSGEEILEHYTNK